MAKLNRRTALGMGSALLGAAALGPASSLNTAAAQEQKDKPKLPPLEIIALSRMGYGLRPGDLEAFKKLPGSSSQEKLRAYVEQQLNPSSIDDSACEAKLQGFSALKKKHSSGLAGPLRQRARGRRQVSQHLPARRPAQSRDPAAGRAQQAPTARSAGRFLAQPL